MAELEDLGGNANLVQFTKLDQANHAYNIKPSHSLGYVQQGATLSFCDINYAVKKRKLPWCGTIVTKKILKHVNGICRPGMNAILGPTGCGKTSLLDVLAGRKDANEVTGQVLIDGHLIPHNFKCMVGYVVQEDYMMGTLTVRENMMFSANLRLPSSCTRAERVERVEDLIMELGLSDCANAKVGNEFARGISGGEKKRTNIGMELVMSPPLLFLDEPTSGLDAATAYAVMLMLKRMAASGRTIIFSIHQPRFSIFKLFDELTLLSKGDVVFQGPAQKALGYFQDMGYVCEEHNNPSDFFLDIINGDSMLGHQKGIGNKLTDKYTSECLGKSEQDTIDLQIELVNRYQESTWNTKLRADLNEISQNYRTQDASGAMINHVNYKASRLKQFLIISGRAVRMIVRSPESLFVQVFAAVVLALFGGGLFYQLSDESAIQNRRGALFFIVVNWIFNGMSALDTFVLNRALFMPIEDPGHVTERPAYGNMFLIISGRAVRMIVRSPESLFVQVFAAVVLALFGGGLFYQLSDESAIQNRRGALFFIVVNWIFNGMSALDTFVLNRALFIHENSNGYYTVSSYCLANLVCDMIPTRIVRSVMYSAITYWMVGLRPDVDTFFIYTLVLFLSQMSASTIAIAVGAGVRSFSIGTSLNVLLYIFMMAFTGLLIQIETMGAWISWFKWFSIFRYGYEALSILELKDRSFCGVMNSSTPIVMCDGNEHLRSQGIDYTTDWDLWSHIVALSGITTACLILTYIQLLRMKKVK